MWLSYMGSETREMIQMTLANCGKRGLELKDQRALEARTGDGAVWTVL